ncbi:MAG: EamA family transporter, partial [Gemmatimonadaceae bacterium]|nr:EamA family transporter [Gemmatimonadaceae bacterium]
MKYATHHMPPLAFNAVRISLAAVVLLIVARATVRERPTRREVLLLLGLGVLGNGIYQMVFVGSVVNTDVGVAALLLASSPAFIALLSRAAGLGEITSRCAIGIALSLAGVALIALTSRTSLDGSSSLEGNLLAVLAAVIWAVYVVLQARYVSDVADT